MNKKKKQVTSVIVAIIFTLTTIINAVPTVAYAHEANKQIELDMYGNTSTDMILYNNTEYTSVNEETIPEIESVSTDNLDNTFEISSDTTWNNKTTLRSNLVVKQGVTLTIKEKVTISGEVTISGGGIIKRGENYKEELISVPKDNSLTLKNITLNGGAVYSGETNSLLNRGIENTGIEAKGALVHSSGTLAINDGTKLEKNFWKTESGGSAAVYVEAGTTTMSGGVICNNYGGKMGAGVYVAQGAKLKLDGGTICHNKASEGAGIFTSGNLNMTGGVCSYNYATNGGGIGIGSTGNVHIEGGSISKNQADVAAKGIGGGIYSNGDSVLEVSGGEISYNTSVGGGGIYLNRGSGGYTVTISDKAKIHHNHSTSIGGGIRASSFGKLAIEGGEISYNTSEDSGGGIYAYNAEVHLEKGTIVGNSISSYSSKHCGGGVYLESNRQLVLGDVTINGNKFINPDNSDNSSKDDIAISSNTVYLSRTNDSGELPFSFFKGPIVFKPFGDKELSINTLKKMSYKSNSGEQKYQMWFNSSEKNIYATEIETNGGEIPIPNVEDSLAIPIKAGHIFKGWYDNKEFNGSQLIGKPNNQKKYYAKWEAYNVKINVGDTMTVTPRNEVQTDETGAIPTITVQAKDGYYLPTNYYKNLETLLSGLNIIQLENKKIVISGTPTSDVDITLLAATEKTPQTDAPNVTGGIGSTINGTDTTMEYASSETSASWADCANDKTEVNAGTWYVRYKETGTQKASPATKVVVTAPTYTAPTYTIAVDRSSFTFDTLNEGYESRPSAQSVTITNTGNSKVTLKNPTSSNYEATLSSNEIEPNKTATLTVIPKANLSAGEYKETIEIKTTQGTSASIDVNFKVNGAFTVSLSASETSIIEGQSVTLTTTAQGGSGTYSYAWYTNGNEEPSLQGKEVTVSPAATITYQVVVTDTIENKTATATVTVIPKKFNDVTPGMASYNAIMALTKRKIIYGCGQHTFKPLETVSRGQVATFLARTLNLPAGDSNFKDLPKSSALYEDISRAAKAGLLVGNNGYVYPNKAASRAEIAVMIDRAMNMKGNYTDSVVLTFKDTHTIGGYAVESVKRMTKYGIIQGKGNNTFAPNEFADRATAAILIHRMVQVMEKNGEMTPPVAP